MKIRTKLILIAVIPVAILLLVSALFITVANRVEQANNKAIIADDITRLFSDLSVLTYEHHTYFLERAHEQWVQKYEQLGKELKDNGAIFDSPDEQDRLKQLQKIHKTIWYLFEQYGPHVNQKSTPGNEAAEKNTFKDRITARLLQELALAVPTSDNLHDLNHDRAIALSKQRGQITILLISVIAIIVPLIAIFVVRSFSAPIKVLQMAVARAGAGDLSISIHSDSPDEIGVLSRLFDDMLQRLKHSDESLRTMNLTLEQRVDERTAALRESETKYRIVADNTYDWEFWLSPEGRFLYISPSCERLTGYTMQEFLSNPGLLEDIIYPDDKALFEQHRHHAVEDKTPDELHFRIIHRDNSTRWMAHICQPVLDNAGAYLGTRGSNRDVTERKLAEEALTQSEATLRAMMNSITESFFLIDAQGICIALNETTAARLGRSMQEMLGSDIFSFVPPDVAVARKARLDEVLRTGKPVSFDDARFGKYIHNSMYPVFDANNTAVRIAIFAMDITERKQTELKLLQKTEELDTFFNVALDLLCIADMDGYFRRLNRAWEKTLGYTLDELRGIRFLDYVHPDDVAATVVAVSALAANQEVINFVNRYRCKDGTYRWIEWRSVPSNNLIYAAARDITEQKTAEEALKQNEERLVALLHLNTMKSGNEDALRSYALEKSVRLTKSAGGYLHFFTEDTQTLQLSNWSKEVMTYCTAAKTPHYPPPGPGRRMGRFCPAAESGCAQ